MKNLTKQLFELGTPLIELKPEISNSKYQMADSGGVETEVGEFLYGLVRLIKPEQILETGTYSGISTMYMAQALKDNNSGKITTLEYETIHRDRAMKLWERIDVKTFIDSVLISSLAFDPKGQKYDLIFLDTEPDIRFAELERYYENLKPGGLLFIHDLPRGMCQGNKVEGHPDFESWPFGNIPDKMKAWLKSGELVKFHFPNPRGMVGFYKPHPEDYQNA